MKIIILLTVILGLLTLTNCEDPHSTNKAITEEEIYIPDSATSYYNWIGFMQKLTLEKELNIPDIRQNDDTVLRIWKKTGPTTFGDLITVKKVNNNWTSFKYFYVESYPNLPNPPKSLLDYSIFLKVDTFTVKKSRLNIDASFFQKLEKNGILELPNQTEIKGFKNRVDDGITYSIEYKYANGYRYFTYNCPDIYEDEFEESKRAMILLEIIDQEIRLDSKFGQRLRCSSPKL